MSQNLDMNAGRESDGCVVPAKCPNKGGSPSPAEGMEGRRPTTENTGQTAASQMQSWGNALAGLNRVRESRLRFAAKPPREEPYALKSARTDPCGGRRVTGVPTATIRRRLREISRSTKCRSRRQQAPLGIRWAASRAIHDTLWMKNVSSYWGFRAGNACYHVRGARASNSHHKRPTGDTPRAEGL